jgi:diguanylate cyclase (GGDEF)-like protein/PAS domain S-box-containing protein
MNETIRVLLVEDDEDDYLLFRQLLTKVHQEEFALDWVPSYEAGLEEIGRDRHDVYVLDHRLGAHSGLELLQCVISRGCVTPIVMLTGVAQHATVVSAMKAGAADYLVKGHIDELLLQRTLRYAVQAKRAADRNRAAEGRFRAAFAGAPTGMALVDVSVDGIGRLLDVNPSLCEMAGRENGELLGRPIWTLFEPGHEAKLVRQLLEGDASEHGVELRLIQSNGERGWVSLHVSVITDSRAMGTQAIAQIVDINDRKETETYLQHLAGQDPVTGLLNRRRFHARLEECLGRSARYGDSGAVLLLNLDGFKQLAGELGESARDELLRTVADALRNRLRSTDVLAKLGGAEFAVVLMEADEEAAVAVAHELVDAVRKAEGVEVPVSVGIAPFRPGTALDADALLIEADSALYRARGLGGYVIASRDEAWIADVA